MCIYIYICIYIYTHIHKHPRQIIALIWEEGWKGLEKIVNIVTFSHLRKKRRFSFERIVSGLLHPRQITYSSEKRKPHLRRKSIKIFPTSCLHLLSSKHKLAWQKKKMLTDVTPKDPFKIFWCKPALHNQPLLSIKWSTCPQLSKQEGHDMVWLPMHPKRFSQPRSC